MEDDIKSRFEDLDKRLASTERRIDDIKWFIGSLTGLFTVIFGVLTILGSLNFNSEKTALHQFERDLKSELGRGEEIPEFELLGADGTSLANQEVPATLGKDKDGKSVMLSFIFTIRNTGNGLSGPIYLKIYTVDPFPLRMKSTDEPKFKYEDYADPSDLKPSQIPGRFSFSDSFELGLATEENPPSGKYPVLIKAFYGKGKLAQASFSIVVNQ
jgi:hypothetical protein